MYYGRCNFFTHTVQATMYGWKTISFRSVCLCPSSSLYSTFTPVAHRSPATKFAASLRWWVFERCLVGKCLYVFHRLGICAGWPLASLCLQIWRARSGSAAIILKSIYFFKYNTIHHARKLCHRYMLSDNTNFRAREAELLRPVLCGQADGLIASPHRNRVQISVVGVEIQQSHYCSTRGYWSISIGETQSDRYNRGFAHVIVAAGI